MKLTGLLIGDGVRRRLEASLGRLSHAYIIGGPDTADVKTLAEQIAAAYVCTGEGDKPCGTCSGCRKVKGGIHPDVIYVDALEGKREIVVGQMRELRAQAYIRPNEAQRKVFVIENAQTMNANAQNALLKVLEDGPSYLSFLFLTDNPQQMLPTIRSRCETLSLMSRPGEDSLQPDEEWRQKADRLAALLMGEDERALAEFVVALETQKPERETLNALFAAVKDALRAELLTHPDRVIGLMERLDEICRASSFNVGTGHLLGWLAAAR